MVQSRMTVMNLMAGTLCLSILSIKKRRNLRRNPIVSASSSYENLVVLKEPSWPHFESVERLLSLKPVVDCYTHCYSCLQSALADALMLNQTTLCRLKGWSLCISCIEEQQLQQLAMTCHDWCPLHWCPGKWCRERTRVNPAGVTRVIRVFVVVGIPTISSKGAN